jgi:sucrose phosphorylase
MLPETIAFTREFAESARRRGIEVLVEIHSHHLTQIDIAKHCDWVYDFALPPLVLHAILFGTAQYLKDWIAIRPHNAITVLDTHDGIGVIDIGADDRTGAAGLVPPTQISALVDRIHANNGGSSKRATGAAASNLDLYQVNCTYYDALGRDDHAYLMARAIQFFFPGVPQVYYVGLLAGENDTTLLESTGVGRDINRHYFKPAELAKTLQRPVVRALLGLIRFRNTHPAFSGSMEVEKSGATTLCLRWKTPDHFALLEVDLSAMTYCISHSHVDMPFPRNGVLQERQ